MRSLPKNNLTVVYTESQAGVIFLNYSLVFAGEFERENIENDNIFLSTLAFESDVPLNECQIDVDSVNYFWQKIKENEDPWNHYLFVSEGENH